MITYIHNKKLMSFNQFDSKSTPAPNINRGGLNKTLKRIPVSTRISNIIFGYNPIFNYNIESNPVVTLTINN